MILSADAKVDFLTVTTDCGCETIKLDRLAEKVAAYLPSRKPWRLLRYVGWRCEHPGGEGGIAMGRIDRGKGIMQLWGHLSHRWLVEVMVGMKAKVTRCDYAVTVLFDKPQPSVLEVIKTLRQSDAVYTAIVPVSEAGGTLYVGSRNSEKYGRVYDKGSQLGTVPPRIYWRYELEYKRSCARNAVQILMDGTQPDAMRDVVLGNVWEYFEKNRVKMPSLLGDVVGYPIVKYAVVARSFDKTLSWLETQVNPALVRLCTAGYGESVTRALGIEGTDCVSVRLNTDTQVEEDLQQDFWDEMQQSIGSKNGRPKLPF